MSRSFAELLPTPLTAESLALLQPLTRAEDLLLLLERWVERGWLRALDKAFVAFLHERAPAAVRISTIACCLRWRAWAKGVTPSLSARFTSAPAAITSRTIC